MKDLPTTRKRGFSQSLLWFAIAAAVLITAAGTAVIPRTAWANSHDPPELTAVFCHSDGNIMLWRTGNDGQVEAPEGWKVERTHLDTKGTDVVQTFPFTGADADALLAYDDRYWEWVDTSADRNVEYTYRVRAINTDGSDKEGRNWSRSVSPNCLQGPLNQPGISIPRCQDNGVWMFWHTSNGGQDTVPDGWKVERRYWDSDRWVVQTFTFIGAQADALQTFNDEYWDWVDTTADLGVAYTYRVRAINSDVSDLSGRFWSRRAPVECGPAVA